MIGDGLASRFLSDGSDRQRQPRPDRRSARVRRSFPVRPRPAGSDRSPSTMTAAADTDRPTRAGCHFAVWRTYLWQFTQFIVSRR